MSVPCPHCGGSINPAQLLGSRTSDAKKLAVRLNGAKGGRPKKPPTPAQITEPAATNMRNELHYTP